MGLTNKQKLWILKNRGRISPAKMANELSLSIEEVTEFIEKQSKEKAPFYFYILMVIIPLLFFIILEICLRLFGYGFNNVQWIDASETKIGINYEIGKRYFQQYSTIPTTIEDTFYREKKDNSFRIFVLGGSSGAGYPYMPLGSFSRYIKRRLELVYPQSTIEVINISMTAVNSYTLRDLFPGVMEQSPDLVLIYAGHNEFYGALGVGSLISLGQSRSLVNAILYLNKYKTVELLRDLISWLVSLFNTGNDDDTGTLMSRMAKEQQIPLNSELYFAGLKQFEGNMRDILLMANEGNVPVMVGTLVSNMKDQPPFISGKSVNLPEAKEIFNEAKEAYLSGNFIEADSLFTFAKDLDELRFRASEEFNSIINKLGEEFNLPVVQTVEAFKKVSPDGIIGDNIMTDHLHPTLEGHQLIGKLFYEKMEQTGHMPKSEPVDLSNEQQDNLTKAKFYFSPLDSVIALYKIKLLKNDWPYITKDKQVPANILFTPKNFIDSAAYDVVMGNNLKWERAQRKVAGRYLKQKNYKAYKNQMDALISQYPIITEYFNIVANEFLKIGKYDIALYYLEERYSIKPDAFSTKWLGNINLFNGNVDNAIKYYEESIKLDNTDPQLLYNAAGAYAQNKEYLKALEMVEKCLTYNGNYPGAVNLKKSLLLLVK